MTAPSDANVLPIRMSERAANPRYLRLHPDDNVVVSIDPILPGATVEGVTAVAPRAQGPQDGDARRSPRARRS